MLRTTLGVLLCLALVWAFCLSGTVAAEEKKEAAKATDATVVKVDGDKVTLKVDDKEQTVDITADKIKLMKGKETAKATDLKEGDKVKVNQKDGKITTIRIGK